MAEGPVDEALPATGPDHRALRPRRQLRDEALGAQQPAELPLVRIDELRVLAQRRLTTLSPLDDLPQLVAELDPEVEGGPDPLGGERQAVAARVADEEDLVLGPGPELVGNPVALITHGRPLQVVGKKDGGVLDVEARVEGADPDPLLVAGWKAPAVAGRDVAAVDPDFEVVRAALGMDLEPPGERGVGRLVAAIGGQDPPPAERVHDQMGRNV